MIAYMAILTTVALLCLSEHAWGFPSLLSIGSMLAACAYAAMFHALFVTPVTLQIPESSRSRTGRRRRRRAFVTAGIAAVWQTALLAPFLVLALRLAPFPESRLLGALGLVALHGLGASLVVLMLGRAYCLLAVLLSAAGPLADFLVRDMGGKAQPWLSALSPFGQLAYTLGAVGGPGTPAAAPPLAASIAIFALIYFCIVAVGQHQIESELETG